jgi:hypothetical protein
MWHLTAFIRDELVICNTLNKKKTQVAWQYYIARKEEMELLNFKYTAIFTSATLFI